MNVFTFLAIMMSINWNSGLTKSVDSYDVDVELSGEVSDEKSLKLLGALIRKLKAKFYGFNYRQIGLGYPGAGCGYACYQPWPQYPYYGYLQATSYSQTSYPSPPIYQQQQQPIMPQILPPMFPSQPLLPQPLLPQPQTPIFPNPNLYQQNYPIYPISPYPQNSGCCLRCSYPPVGC